MKIKLLILNIIVFSLISCNNTKKTKNDKLNVVSTTTIIHDIVKNIGGDHINAEVIMGAGVDPHLYKASENDVNIFHHADIIFYNGLHLEGKLVDLFEKMELKGKSVFAVSQNIPKEKLITSESFASSIDPHIWFDISLWKLAAKTVLQKLMANDAKNKNAYEENYNMYIKELNELNNQIIEILEPLNTSERILITAHDAFNYFGNAYNFEVIGLQGISTASEAGVKDVQNLTNYIVKHKVKAIFIETSVSKKNIKALQEAVNAQGFKVKIGGELFSDALGSKGTPEESYKGMFLHNIKTIVNALK